MSSPKSKSALSRLGADLRAARLTRKIAISDLAARAGASSSTITRLERGDPGVGIGTLADVLVALGLSEQLAELVDARKDDIALSLASERAPQRGRTYAARLKRAASARAIGYGADIDPDGTVF